MKRAIGVLAALVAVAACSSDQPAEPTTAAAAATTTTAPTTTSSTTTTTTQPTTTTLSEADLQAIQLEEDTSLIRALWRGYSDSWERGHEFAREYLATHGHPSMECAVDDFADYYADVLQSESYFQEVVVDVDTIEPDPEWVIPDSGLAPTGRIYIHQATITDGARSALLLELHVAIVDDEAYLFFPCREPT